MKLSLYIAILITFFTASTAFTQDKMESSIPYHQIPDAPEDYSSQNILARMIDGLGYRYYWATHELREEDLDYEPGNDGMSAREVLDHLHGLSEVIMNAVKGEANIRPRVAPDLIWEDQRKMTLENLNSASQMLKSEQPNGMDEIAVTFQRGEKKSSFPVWILINGPLADAIWHAGQIASYRRSSGNPVHPGMNVFLGKTKE